MGDHIPKTFSYLRVSTDRQDLEKDKIEVLNLARQKAFGEVRFVEEKITGKAPWKTRKIKFLIDDMQKMDRLIVPELSRL
ncbi:resolvase, partial [bacterium]|nr:resolvase [bacterium]